MLINDLSARTLEPRKGHAQVLDAFEQLWPLGVDANLVIVGKQGWMVDELVARLRSHLELRETAGNGVGHDYIIKLRLCHC